MNQKQVDEILKLHKDWLKSGGRRGQKADFRGADLQGANLQGADLWGEDLRSANLRGADLWGADLRGADLWGADLRGADLWGADLWGADLRGADLWGADLRSANLRSANLWGANLRSANLWGADLRGADLRGANLDYSCWPLWCGSLKAHIDDRQAMQLAYHLVSAGLYSKNTSEETKRELSKLVGFANRFHRIEECGRLEPYEENKSEVQEPEGQL